MHRQQGVTLSGFILWAVVFIFAALLGFKIGPPYFEYLKIQKQLQEIVKDDEARSGLRRDVESAFVKRSLIEDINAISAKDLIIAKEGDGIVVSAEYSTCVPIMGNLRACMDFAPSSAK